MADNYLENKFEEYKRRKAGNSSSHTRKSNMLHHTKRVFITGGANGIGKAIVKEFRAAGHRVAFCDIDEKAGKETAFLTGTTFIYTDVSDIIQLEQTMKQLFEQWGDIDIIINHAHIKKSSPITATPVEDFDHILSVNLRSVFVTARQLAIHRQNQVTKNEFGRILNICSIGYLMSEPENEGYTASAGGIYSLTHALCNSLSEMRITVNSISTEGIQRDNNKSSNNNSTLNPVQRAGRPEDIARMCLFLCREENDFINGENITIDGGLSKILLHQK